jgi:hypothetical protein
MIIGLKPMFRLLVNSLAFAPWWVIAVATPMREAANPSATPVNQLLVSGNACGPTALLNAFRFGNPDWQRASNSIAGESDKQRIYSIIREYGMRPSAMMKGRPRWSKNGVNLADLCDIANEMTRGLFLPLVSHEVLFRAPHESQQALLKRVLVRLNTSLEKGLPPVVSLRRYVKRDKSWVALDAHFVTLIKVPRTLEKGAASFEVSYIDPWGGKACQGTIGIPESAVLAGIPSESPCLEADFPQASVGKKLVRQGEATELTIAAILGRW